MNHSRLTDVVETITLTMGQLCSSRTVEEWVFAEAPEVSARYITETARVMLTSMVRYAEQPCKPVTYPADWWQAVKQRFAPAWFLARWPVELAVWEPFVIYPEIKLPDHRHYVQIRRLSEMPAWRS